MMDNNVPELAQVSAVRYENEKAAKNEYYLRNKHAGYLGNAPVWWCKNGQGYSAYLERAERWTEEKAAEMVKEDPSKWEMFPCGFIDQRLHQVYDAQSNHELDQWRTANQTPEQR